MRLAAWKAALEVGFARLMRPDRIVGTERETHSTKLGGCGSHHINVAKLVNTVLPIQR